MVKECLQELRLWSFVNFPCLLAVRLLVGGLPGDPPDSRRNIIDQATEIQGFDHAYVKSFLEGASSMLRIAQTGQCDRDNSPGFLRWMVVQRLQQGKSIQSGHRYVTYQDVGNLTADYSQSLLRGLRGNSNRTKSSQKFRERLARITVIFNDKNPGSLKRPRLRIRDFGTTLQLGPGCTVCSGNLQHFHLIPLQRIRIA